jgi:signal transduction histidine kinase
VPAVLNGVIYNRFPSGRPIGRLGTVLDRLLLWGTGVMAIIGVLGTGPDALDLAGSTRRFVDHTPLPGLLEPAVIGIPALILLGGIAGVSVIVRFLRSCGLERKQLVWVASAAAVNLVAFPFAVAEVIPAWLGNALLFVLPVSVLVPVLRYDLWAIDSIVRRSATYHLVSGETAVQGMVRGMGEMLKLPYVAVRRDDRVLASYGPAADHVETWPLVHGGQTVGHLVAAPRYGYDRISRQDRQVLASTGELVAGSVLADALTSDLVDARQRLVTTREEERRRLRRDLHDGLGPMLTGLGLNLDAARADPERAADYLANAKKASTQVITEIRDLVHGLRPPMLDELGLVGALTVQTEQAGMQAGLATELHAPDRLQLPAAVEVAVYRTVVEAVNNVVKHTDATRVSTTISCAEDVTVTVEDDGSATRPWTAGVGLTGMRERAEELGGTFEARPTGRGGRIRATLPLGEPGT